jgi:oligopeptidase B
MKHVSQLAVILPLLIVACATAKVYPPQGITTPIAQKIPYHYQVNGADISDEYYWMRDPDQTNQATLDYIQAENNYADSILAPLGKKTTRLLREMERRFPNVSVSYPYPADGYEYYSRYPKDSDYPLFCRVRQNDRPIDGEHPWRQHTEEIILDGAKEASDREFFDIGETDASPDGHYLAWTSDSTGAENYTMHIRDLTTGTDLPETIYPASGGAWTPDGTYLFYMRYQDPTRDSASQIWRHATNTPAIKDVLVYQETDPTMDAFVYLCRNREYLVIGTGNDDTSEYRVIPAKDPTATPHLFQARKTGVYYTPYFGADRCYLLTDRDGACNYKIMTAPLGAASGESWENFYVPGDSVFVTDLDLYHDWLAVREVRHGLPMIRVFNLAKHTQRTVNLPGNAYTVSLSGMDNFDSNIFRYNYTSLACPYSLYEYDMAKGTSTLLQQDPVEGFNPGKYVTKRVFATAQDGTKVPISLLYRRDLFKNDGTNPLYVYAYGSYGMNSDPEFSTLNLTLVDRGFVYAIAHIRGGSEMGRQWFEGGRLMNKKHSFQDYIDCTEFLLHEKYGDPKRVVAEGASAGGMLMGVVSNWRPDLFTVVLAGVPAADEFTHEQDSTLAGVAYHHQQWGDPLDPVQGAYFHSWDVYQNIATHDYPIMFITAGLYDTRVPYWEPAKWTARLRDRKTGDNLILLTTETTGHMGETGRFGIYSEYAVQYEFIFHLFGLD